MTAKVKYSGRKVSIFEVSRTGSHINIWSGHNLTDACSESKTTDTSIGVPKQFLNKRIQFIFGRDKWIKGGVHTYKFVNGILNWEN